MKILVIDDSEDTRLFLKSVMNASGYQDVMLAGSAKEAFRLLGLGKARSSGVKADLIIMDILMPEMDGIEACRQIKGVKRYRDIPIVMVTAHNESEYLESAFNAGANDYITKPVNKTELLARVRSALCLKEELDRRRSREKELSAKNSELRRALREIKQLRGLIPICAYCKKIRNDRGFWEQVEVYLSEHTEARFSHCMCEVCEVEFRRKYFGEDAEKE